MISFHRGSLRPAMFVLLATYASVAGCARISQPGDVAPAPAQRWTSELAMSRRAATNGRFDVADSMLADYATKHAGTVEALETAYWRAMLRMDPANQHPSLAAAMALLDGYLADVRPHEHAAEAATLRRLAAQLDVLNRVTASMTVAARGAVDPGGQGKAPASVLVPSGTDQTANDAEIKRLKDELAKVNAELDRIKKRLATPPP
ncbi:MAG: hypothetical protein ABI442_17580 [Gemmatimonadaceae bacterium]